MAKYYIIGEDIPDTQLTADQARMFLAPLPETNGKYPLDDDYYLIVKGGKPRQPKPAPQKPETFADFKGDLIGLLPNTDRPQGRQMGTAEIIGYVFYRLDTDGRSGYEQCPPQEAELRNGGIEWESRYSTYALKGVYGEPIICHGQCDWRSCPGVKHGQPCCKQTLFRESSPLILTAEEEEKERKWAEARKHHEEKRREFLK